MLTSKAHSTAQKKSIFLITIAAFAIISISLVLLGTYYSSRYYLYRAKNGSVTNDKIRYYETSLLFWDSREATMSLADKLFEVRDYSAAATKYAQVEDQMGFRGFTKAIYEIGNYSEVIETAQNHSSLASTETNNLLIRSLIKQGKLAEARTNLDRATQSDENIDLRVILLDFQTSTSLATQSADLQRILGEKSASNKYNLASNELEKRGFPQAAFALLQEGYKRGDLDRNALLALAQAQIDRNDYKTAKEVLIKASGIDSYYPQTFRQLIVVSTKLGDNSDVSKYQERLAAISW